jgi:hypothetical protein
MFEFDSLELITFGPQEYVAALHGAIREGYDGVIVDSLSHAWTGTGGELDQVDKIQARPGENKFTAWRHVTPQHTQLVDLIVGYPIHLIVTMRVKTEYVLEEYITDKGEKKQRPRKVGLAPVMREGMEYELDALGDFDLDHQLTITKSRIGIDGMVFHQPGLDLAEAILANSLLNNLSAQAADILPRQRVDVPTTSVSPHDQPPAPSSTPAITKREACLLVKDALEKAGIFPAQARDMYGDPSKMTATELVALAAKIQEGGQTSEPVNF